MAFLLRYDSRETTGKHWEEEKGGLGSANDLETGIELRLP